LGTAGTPNLFTLGSAGVPPGTDITFQCAYTHSLVTGGVIPASQLTASYYSDLQGQLADVFGNTAFGVTGQLVVPTGGTGALIAGTHHITVIISDGQRVASNSAPVIIKSPNVNATLVNPTIAAIYFPPAVSGGTGDAVSWQVQSVFDNTAASPIISWY